MAQFPFVYNYQTGRTYYGPALEEKAPTPQLWLRGPQTPFYERDNPPSKVAWAAAGTGAAFAAGFLPTKKGGRIWDWYVKGIRAVEEYSPAQIFRTFQLSTFFSQFETATKTLKLTPELLRGNRPYAEYLAQLIGGKDDVYGRLIREGVELKEGRLIWSKKGDTALRWAAGLRVPQGSHAYYPSAYARSIGATGIFEKAGLRGHRFLADKFPIFYRPQVINPVIEGMPTTIIGGRHLPQHLWRQAAGWGTEWISRFNRLLEAPFEMQPFRTVFGKVQVGLKKVTGRELAFAVKEGPGLRMLGKLSLKYGLAATAIGLGYQTVDWMTRRSELLDHTAFSEGITAGVSTLGIRASLTAAELAERSGLQRYREFQEEVAPGSTSIQKLFAFPIMGGSAALLGSYGIKVYRMAKTQLTRGIPAHEARRLVVEGMKEFGGEGLFARMGRALTTPKGLYARQDIFGRAFRKVATKEGDRLSFAFLGKLGPTKLAGLLGIAGGAALTLPFWPGALIPETSPEELRRIYSGEQEIPIRRGRWWEFGRSAFEGQRIMYYRPHWYPRMMMRAREKSIWGPEEDELSPLEKLWRREFSYELEKAHYRERPYPITSLPFEDVPFIGPLLSNTLGRLIKPLRVMHTEEWVGKEGVVAEAPGFGERIATEIGETPGGVPESPYGIKGAVGEQIYRLQEMFGLAGFAQVSLKERLTGSGDWFDQITQLESARRIAGFERFYWDLELGGLLGTTEAFRRLYPHRRRQIPLYNPIRNLMPEWLPGPGEKSPDFLHGDPYCITSGTFVEVLEGCFKRVCDLTIDDMVRTHTGKWVQPKKIMKRDMGLGEKLFEIKVSSLSAFPVRASEEHPFWTADGWVQAKDLEVGNYVGYPLPKLDDLLVDDGDQLLDLTQYCDLPANTSHIFIQGSQEYADCVEFVEKNPGPYHRGERKKILNNHGWSAKTFENAQRGLKNGSLNRIPRRINPWCAEWGLLTGYYAAEGSSYNGSVSFALDEDEKVYQEQILNALQYLFNLNGTIYPNSTGRGVQLVVTNKALAQILPNILGYNSYNKRLPLWAGSFIPALSALFNGDGSFFFDQDKPRLSLKSKSQKLLWSVRQFLLLWGFVGSIVEDNLVYRGQAAKDCARFISTLKYQNCPNSSRLCRHTYIKNNYVWMRVFSKEEIPQEPVYGIEVDIDDSFCVVGIATHNTKVPEGELRLPGRGYEARFPELASVKPEDYPLIHKYKVLADVAPYSDKFKLYRNMVRAARKGDTWSEEEETIYKTTEEQVSAKKKRIEFQEYQYLSPMGKIFDEAKRWGGEESSELIAALNRASTEEEKESVFKRLFGGYWELLAHNAETAFDQLTPVSPGAKLVHVRTPIEAYERLQVYGTESAFWQHPVKHFIRPFSSLFAKGFGFEEVPEHIKNRRNLEQYFDTIEYVKYARLANMARKGGDVEAVKEFEKKKDETLFGINPFTRNYSSIFRALPRRERDYFNAFAEAGTTEERARILELVPENEKALYVARWKLAFADEIKKAGKAGILTEQQLAEADEVVDGIYDEARAEGFPHTKELFAEYIETRMPGESYGDWYRRTKLLSGVPLPGPDWVGWHPSVDLEDIKLRVVQNIGEDMHDYDLWPSRAQTLVNKPYLTDEAIEAIMQPEELTEVEMRDRINELLLAKGIRPHVTMNTTYGNVSSSLNVDIEQEYDEDIVQVLRENRG